VGGALRAATRAGLTGNIDCKPQTLDRQPPPWGSLGRAVTEATAVEDGRGSTAYKTRPSVGLRLLATCQDKVMNDFSTGNDVGSNDVLFQGMQTGASGAEDERWDLSFG